MMISLPREVTYDPALQQLLFFPIAEMAALRSPATPIATVPKGTVVSRRELHPLLASRLSY